MIEIEDLGGSDGLTNPLMLAAFEGWNDCGAAATGVIDHLIDVWDARLVGAMDPEDFYDFQVNRPNVSTDESGMRRITWPSTQIYLARSATLGRDVLLVRGIEPNMRWRQFCAELLAAGSDLGVTLVCTLGAVMAEVPHTRPIQVSGTATELDLHDRLQVEAPRYEGPTGVVGVLEDACGRLDIPAVAFWAAIPHYVSAPPCPKGTLALLAQVEDLIGSTVSLEDLVEDSRAWERGADEYLKEDEDLAEYVHQLEESADAATLPQASGEAIAREFERYLERRRGDRDE
ncbi:MAG: filament polymerization regulator ParJ [Marmoricola sp.]